MTGFATLLRKELVEAWRTMRLPVVLALFLFVGLSSPLLARFMPEIIEFAAGDLGTSIPLPTPTVADAVDQVQKNLAQFGALTAIVLAMGAVSGELDRGTAGFILARPVGRAAFLVAKVAALGAVLAIGVAVTVVVGWIYTAILFEPPSVGGWLWLACLAWLGLAAWAAITFVASAVTGSTAAAAGLGFVGLLVLSLLAAIPAIGRFTPAGLASPAMALASGAAVDQLGPDLWVPLVATVVLIVGAVGVALVTFRRREI
jgi:ABC-2 type transport system permease protein